METEVSKKLDDIHDFLVNSDLTSIPASVFEDLKYLEDHIADLERCVVMGGDGKPIVIGEERFVNDNGKLKSFIADQIFRTVSGKTLIVADGDEEERWYVDCTYSSPDQVLEGGK